MDHYFYILEDKKHSVIKIGITKNFIQRLSAKDYRKKGNQIYEPIFLLPFKNKQKAIAFEEVVKDFIIVNFNLLPNCKEYFYNDDKKSKQHILDFCLKEWRISDIIRDETIHSFF